jgi:large subunit ribosomal protein L21
MEKILIELGITTFAQIAAWTDADIEKLDEQIKPKGRIAREEWVEQAKELMAGKPPRAKSDRERE